MFNTVKSSKASKCNNFYTINQSLTQNQISVIKLYSKSFEKYGFSPRATLWPSEELQSKRFKELLLFDVSADDSILDVGCGLADLKMFLKKLGWRGYYCGIDIVKQFIEATHLKYAGIDVRYHDISLAPTNQIFDWAFISGLFNTPFENAFEYMQRVLQNSYDSICRGIVFNYISTSLGECRPQMSYYDTEAVVKFCEWQFRNSAISITCAEDGNVSVLVLKSN